MREKLACKLTMLEIEGGVHSIRLRMVRLKIDEDRARIDKKRSRDDVAERGKNFEHPRTTNAFPKINAEKISNNVQKLFASSFELRPTFFQEKFAMNYSRTPCAPSDTGDVRTDLEIIKDQFRLLE